MRWLVFISCFILFINGKAQNTSRSNDSLTGEWLLDFESNDIGSARTFFTFKTDSSTFTAYTRKNADRDMLGGTTSRMARMFGQFKGGGSLLRIVNGKTRPKGDSLLLSGVFTSPMGNYYFNGSLVNGALNAVLSNNLHQPRGKLSGTKKSTVLLEDYSALFESSVALTEKTIFNRRLMDSGKWKKFNKKMRKVSKRTQDDLEMVFAFFYYGRKLPVSHYALMKIPDQKKDLNAPVVHNVWLEERQPQTGIMKITSFEGSAREMDSVFDIVILKEYKNLIVDLRNNSGGSVEAGMAFSRRLTSKEFYGGVFLTQKWFNKHDGPPAVKEYSTFPLFTESNFDLIIEGIHKTEGLCLRIVPGKNIFNGVVYILTNNQTASTCEPIVYGFKQHKRAIVVGEKTAGAMLNGEALALDKGFKLVVPTADYYASDGYHIDRVGVKPDLNVKQEGALEHALKLLSK